MAYIIDAARWLDEIMLPTSTTTRIRSSAIRALAEASETRAEASDADGPVAISSNYPLRGTAAGIFVSESRV